MKNEGWLYLTETLQRKYPKCIVELYYDKKNLMMYNQKWEKAIKNLEKLICILNKQKIYSQIFVRVHYFNYWLIVRIKVEKQDNFMEKEIKKVFCGELISIASDTTHIIIKLCYPES